VHCLPAPLFSFWDSYVDDGSVEVVVSFLLLLQLEYLILSLLLSLVHIVDLSFTPKVSRYLSRIGWLLDQVTLLERLLGTSTVLGQLLTDLRQSTGVDCDITIGFPAFLNPV